MTPPPIADTHAESSLTAALRQEFQQGMRAARDSQNADLPELALRITTVNSRWYTAICPACKQKFREDDQVRLCPQCGRAYHDDDQYHLHCWQSHFAAGRPCTEERINPFDGRRIEPCTYRWHGTLPQETAHAGGNTLTATRSRIPATDSPNATSCSSGEP